MDYPQLGEIAIHHFDSFRYLFHRNAVNMMARMFNPPGSLYRSGAATEALIEMEGNLQIPISEPSYRIVMNTAF